MIKNPNCLLKGNILPKKWENDPLHLKWINFMIKLNFTNLKMYKMPHHFKNFKCRDSRHNVRS